MASFPISISRRNFLAASTLAISDLALTGCCRHGTKILKTGALLTPPGVPMDTPLTIDVHCHIFNGTDLQIEKFLGDVISQTWWAKAAGEILQSVNWSTAPSGDEEIAKLEQLVHPCATAGGVTRISSNVQSRLDEYRNDGYKRARQSVLEVQLSDAKNVAAQGKVLSLTERSTRDAKQQIYERFASAPDYKSFQQNLKAAPSLTENMKQEITAMRRPGILREQSAMANLSATTLAFSLKGAIQFIVQYFQYRYVSAQDYLTTFTPNARRDVDLMLASMVDYDWWLAKGNPTTTRLDTQVAVMELISILSDGRVHGFVPFCPLREVAARAGLKNGEGEITKSSLQFVQDAVRNKGCVGVKLYPPMGFAPYGNASLDDPSKGGSADFWQGGLLPDWTSSGIQYSDNTTKPLGQRMDDALDDLYQWCVDEQVPILAHTNQTNGPSCAYKKLASAHYWALALYKYPDLRVNFGHLGGIDESISTAYLPKPSKDFVAMLGAAKSKETYGDVAYSSNMVLKPSAYGERIQTAYEQATDGTSQLPSHLLYGTDWSLLEQVGNNEVYMQKFAQLFERIERSACAGHSAEDCFFGWNAVEYLGLYSQPGKKNAWSRLEEFYARHCMPKPAWMQKLVAGRQS